MRLFELITHTSTVGDDNEDLGDLESQALNDPDDSSFSFVVPDEDPHMVKKYNKSYDASYKDGFVMYAEYVVEYKLWDESVNFPRIYNTNATPSDREVGSRYDWRIERLIPWTEVSKEEFKAMVERYFVGPIVSRFGTGETERVLADGITIMLKRLLEGSSEISARDEGLSVALSWLGSIKKYYNFNGYDIHKDNIMYRRTPVGLQLVFNDPFGFAST